MPEDQVVENTEIISEYISVVISVFENSKKGNNVQREVKKAEDNNIGD